MTIQRKTVHRTLTSLAGAIGLLVFLFLASAPAAASSQTLGGSTIGLATDVATQSLQLQERRGRTGTTSRGSSSTRTAPSSRSSSDTRGRVNTGVRRGGDYSRGSRHYRGGRGRGYYGGSRGYYGRSYYPYYYPGWYSSFYWWGPPAYYSGYGAYRYGSDDYYSSSRAGALDLDIKPEEAEVWVNGEYAGIADNFDGFPRYLWLPEGDHRLVFFLDGYRTAAREFTIQEGVVLQVKTRLDQGESKPALEFFPKQETRAKARIQRDREQAREQEQRRPYRYSDRDDSDSDKDEAEDESWRDRRSSSTAESTERTGDFRVEPARLILEIEPSDAVVYLDGRLLGSGEELTRLHSALLIDAGEHELEVVRPGYDSETVEFEADPGEDVELEVELDRD